MAGRWKEQEAYIDHILSKLEASGADQVAKLKESENKLQLRIQESTRRENVLSMRLATKQQEMQDLVVRPLSAALCNSFLLCILFFFYLHTPACCDLPMNLLADCARIPFLIFQSLKCMI